MKRKSLLKAAICVMIAAISMSAVVSAEDDVTDETAAEEAVVETVEAEEAEQTEEPVYYDIAPADLQFTPRSGRYIYCNNPEFITRDDIVDDSNDKATYLMNNEDLGPDNYSIFVSHVNHTDLRNGDGTQILENGFDIEVDVAFEAVEDTVVRITALGFEVPENVKYYMDGKTYTMEMPWGCFDAWSDYLDARIAEIDSGSKYYPVGFEPVEFEIKAGEIKYLSEYISNYREVPYYRPVHIIADFEIVSGTTDVNVLATRATGVLRDRSNVAKNPQRASFVYEHQHKGIADTLNQMDADLAYTIDDSDASGSILPVTVHNQYVPDGNVATMFVTHINPRSDFWSKANGDETGMVKLNYYDPMKHMYYGKNVSESDYDLVWHFDTTHSELAEYPAAGCSYTKNKFVPNFELSEDDPDEYACSLGNYGVFMNYNISITNDGNNDRWFNYKLNTTSSNLIILRDADGEIVSPYPICKGYHDSKEEDILACVELPAHETTEFTLTVVLTTNYLGGMENTFYISDSANPVKTYTASWTKVKTDSHFTGREQVRWINGELYTMVGDSALWRRSLSTETTEKFTGHWNEYKILWRGGTRGYIAKNTLYDGIPYYYVRDFYRTVYFFDEAFNLTGEYTFDSYPTDMAVGVNGVYVKAGSKLYSTDGETWTKPADSSFDLPVYNYSRFATATKNGNFYITDNDADYYKVVTDKDIVLPLYTDGMFYISNDDRYFSYDGVYWSEDISTIYNDAEVVIIDDEAIEMSAPALAGKLPLAAFAEAMGFETAVSDDAVSVYTDGTEITVTLGEAAATVNGVSKELSAESEYILGSLMVSVEDINALFGMNVTLK